MSKAKDPAFPTTSEVNHYFDNATNREVVESGLTKREYYAALAMQGYIASYAGASKDPDPKNVAAKAIEYADALIAELEK